MHYHRFKLVSINLWYHRLFALAVRVGGVAAGGGGRGADAAAAGARALGRAARAGRLPPRPADPRRRRSAFHH